MAMSGGGLYLINPPAFFLFNFHAPSHQIEESGSGASQRMFILQANSLFMLILTSQRGSCKLRSKFKKKKKFTLRMNHSLNAEEEPSETVNIIVPFWMLRVGVLLKAGAALLLP